MSMEDAGAVAAGAATTRSNRLSGETSPYLLQHAHNPVDWYPWGEEALTRAREEEKPIFLSIGYSACHWCHVMERESFENEAIAQVLNERFVNIKVDREERPDLDEIYMHAVVAMTGSGGWPMSVFLTPDREPFYGGTYYPPVDLYGRPGFPSIIQAVANAWENRRGEVVHSAAEMREHLERNLGGGGQRGALTETLLRDAALQLEQSFDETHGGWGGAPKFPSSGSIQVLLRQLLRQPAEQQILMVRQTLDQMANGGIYDHLGGGFHRYSVDAQWLVPHFEKMLYDNAQLAQAYLEAYQVTGEARYAQVVRETVDYVLRDMQDAAGGFYSTEDADSEGEEGKFYVWTEAQVRDVAGREAAPLFCAYYTVRREGNFKSHESYHRGQNILHVTRSLDAVAREFGLPVETAEGVIAGAKAKLLQARARRVPPAKDDKVITAWNGLMLSAVARAAAVFGDARYREAAVRAAEFVHRELYREGRLLRTSRGGQAKLLGYLDDYAFVCNGYLDVYEASFDPCWLERARELADRMQALFRDAEHGSFFYTSGEHRDVLVRTRPTYDGAEPSGNSVAALALMRLHRFFNVPDYFHNAMLVLESNQHAMRRAPQGYPKMLCAVDFALGPGHEVAVITEHVPLQEEPLVRAVQQRFLPRTVVAAAAPADAGEHCRVPLLAHRTLADGRPAAYVCENFTCALPATEEDALIQALS